MTGGTTEGATGVGAPRQTLPVIGRLVLATIVGVWVIPTIGFVVGTGLDPSWGVGLHMAHARGLLFGRDIAWTFGPLGFLVAPTMAHTKTGLAAYWIRLPLVIGAAWFVINQLARVYAGRFATGLRAARAARICAIGALAIPVTWLLIGVQAAGGNIAVAVFVCAAAFAVRAAFQTEPVARRWLIIGALLSAVGLLVRFDTGLVGLAIMLLLSVDRSTKSDAARRIIIAVLTAVGGTVAMWVALGQSLPLLPRYLRNSFELGRGYGSGMALNIHPAWTTPVVVASPVLAAVCVALSRPAKRPTLWGALLIGGLAITNVQQSFGRYDTGHALRLVVLSASVVMVFLNRKNRIVSALVLLYLVVAGTSLQDVGQPFPRFGWPKGPVPFAHPTTGARYLWRTVEFTVSGSRRAGRIQREHDRLGQMAAVPTSIRDVARGKSVHIEPVDASLVWIHDWRWRPLPVFQSYQANTPLLDNLNAAVFRDPKRAPDVVITRRDAVDSRLARWVSPNAMLELVCRYSPAASEDGWTAWSRRPANGCNAPAFSTKRLGVPEGRRVFEGFLADSDKLVTVRFVRSTSLTSSVTDRPLHAEVNGQAILMTAALVNHEHVAILPKCVKAGLFGVSGMDPSDYFPTKLDPSITGVIITTRTFQCG